MIMNFCAACGAGLDSADLFKVQAVKWRALAV